MTRPFDAVIFDFSGVMVTSAFDAFADLGPRHGMSGAEMLEFLLGPYDEDTDHSWHRAERGEISITEWIGDVDTRARSAGFEFDFSAMSTLLSKLDVVDEMVAAAKSVRSDGYRTALLTNNIAEGRSSWSALIPVDELFDVVVDSSAVGMRKPNPAIYRLTLDRLGGLEPGRALFLDDHAGNIAGAESVGLATIHVTDPPSDAAALLRLLGEPTGAQPSTR